MNSEKEVLETIELFQQKRPDSIRLYLIKKRKTDNKEKKFEVSAITIEDEPVESFVNVINGKFLEIKQNIKNNKSRLIGFYDDDALHKNNDLTVLEKDAILGYNEMLGKMSEFDQLRHIKNLQKEEKFDSIACEFKFDSDRIIYFRKTSYKTLIKKDKNRFWFKFLDGKFSKIIGDIFTFDEKVDCIYFESTGYILVLDKINTENIFDFKDYYIKYAIKKLKNMQTRGEIKISDDVLDLENKLALCKKITSIDMNNRFDKKISDFEKCEKFFKEHEGEYREDLTQIEIKEQSLVINTTEKLDTFVHLSNQDIVRDIITDELFVSLKKESMKK